VAVSFRRETAIGIERRGETMRKDEVLRVEVELGFRYPRDPECVYRVPAGLALGRGEAWCIAGESGCGKSTVMALLAALRRPEQGRLGYRFGGEEPVEVAAEAWGQRVGPVLWRHIGFAFQRPELVRALSVVENLRLVHGDGALPLAPLFGDSEWRQLAAARAWEISGGQLQRLGLLRAFGAGQDLVFLDEPTNNLDPRNRAAVAAWVREQSRDRALVVVSHDRPFLDSLEIDHFLAIEDRSLGQGRRVRTLRPTVRPQGERREESVS
jgi:putative ABC transport system ATP-binding protein